MYELIIENYINNIKIEDIVSFSKENNIYLSEYELQVTFHTIKTRYKELLGDHYEEVFHDIKKEFSPNNFNLICNLFMEYRNKFQGFLN